MMKISLNLISIVLQGLVLLLAFVFVLTIEMVEFLVGIKGMALRK